MARLVRPSWAGRTPSPLHDALDPVTRATILATNPDSWLHVARRADEAPHLDPHEVAHLSAAALERLLNLDAYTPAEAPCFYIYRYQEISDGHVQTGLVVDLPIESFLDGRALGHERVDAHRVRSLAAHQSHLSMRGDLVALLHSDQVDIHPLVNKVVSSQDPEVTIEGALRHEVWRVSESENETIADLFASERLFIIDGHHRVAAAIEEWRSLGEPAGYRVLSLITPGSQLRCLSFDRRVVGPLPLSHDQISDRLRKIGELTPSAGTRRRGTVMIYLHGQWWDLAFPPTGIQGVASLDVIRLHDELLGPLLGIGQVGDIRLEITSQQGDVDLLEHRCDNDDGVAFVLAPPTVAEIIDVAERGEQMPHKSTFFDPKPWSGVLISSPHPA
jgi:uncharacterized protein (DUF1015 family)